jgi:hypothetical protein
MGIRYENHYGYSNRKRYISGKGFVDSILPSLNSVGDYVTANKDLIAKPVLAALGALAASGVTAAGSKIVKKIRGKKVNGHSDDKILDAKGKELIQQILAPTTNHQPTTGSGIKRF